MNRNPQMWPVTCKWSIRREPMIASLLYGAGVNLTCGFRNEGLIGRWNRCTACQRLRKFSHVVFFCSRVTDGGGIQVTIEELISAFSETLATKQITAENKRDARFAWPLSLAKGSPNQIFEGRCLSLRCVRLSGNSQWSAWCLDSSLKKLNCLWKKRAAPLVQGGIDVTFQVVPATGHRYVLT